MYFEKKSLVARLVKFIVLNMNKNSFLSGGYTVNQTDRDLRLMVR